MKAVLVDDGERVLASASVALETQHPAPLASEQDPQTWLDATCGALDRLAAEAPIQMQDVRAIGFAGQMHAALLLDAADRPVRPAMLWNDGRAHAEADALKRLGLELSAELGVPAMAGLTGPKLAWLARHEPANFARARTLLSAKDFLRLHLSGERATDVSDAAGTWLLDQARRAWSERAIEAVGVDPGLLPPIVESTTPTGTLRPDMARRFGLADGVVLAGGGGDTPVGGVGIGAVEEGQAFVSLGTSAQIFVATASHRSAPQDLVHAFCHAVPGRWCQMAALLNGASVLGLIARLTGHADPAPLLEALERSYAGPGKLLMLPYLAGERTPHDDPQASGVLLGLRGDTTQLDLVQAALEGVAYSLADARDALAGAGTRIAEASFIGGGARSALWGRIIASVLGIRLHRRAGSARGPAFGAARLARAALGEAASFAMPAITETFEPDPVLTDAYAERLPGFRSLYRALRPEFAQ